MPSCAKGMLPLFISTSLPVLMLAQIQRNWRERRRLGLTRGVKRSKPFDDLARPVKWPSNNRPARRRHGNDYAEAQPAGLTKL